MLQIKKHLSFHSLSLPFALILLLFSSCAKDGDSLIEGKIFLTTENHLSPDKTSVSGTTVQWVKDDMVRLYVGNGEDVLPVAFSDTSAYVNGWSGGVVRAYYPYTIIGDGDGATDTPTITIPSRYDSYYNDKGRQVLALPMAGRAESGATVVEFKHLTAALMVNLKNDNLSELTLDSIVVSSNSYLLSGAMGLDLMEEGFGVTAQTGSGSVTVHFTGITIGTNGIETVQIPIRPIGESDLQIEVYAHCLGDAVSIDGVPAVFTTVIYHYNDTKHVAALGRNVMMAAGIALSAGGHTSTDIIDNALFSVSRTKKVYFSKGNLWYTGSSYTFHTNQYECNGTSQSASDKDLFPWKDTTYISGWNVLTAEEWNYLLDTSSRSATRFAKACVNGVNGLIIFPDTYSHPIGQTLRNVNEKGTVSYPVNYGDNTFNTTQWSQMETAGAIFLPAAGYLDGTTVGEYGSQGDYWSSTTDGDGKAKRLEFKNNEVTTANGINRSYGCSVRLVTTVNSAR